MTDPKKQPEAVEKQETPPSVKLEAELDAAKQREKTAFAVYHQAVGARLALEQFLARTQAPISKETQ